MSEMTDELAGLDIGSQKWNRLVVSGAESMGIKINWEQVNLIAKHCVELVRWNKKVNLTAITNPTDIVVNHVLDSIAPVHVIPDNARVLDIGSGGGFPGIPLKIIKSSLSATLVDASRKKTHFLKHIIRLLELKKIEALHERTETLSYDERYAKQFQVVICRSFSALDEFVLTASSFVSNKGMIIALKGRKVKDELELLKMIKEKNQYQHDFDPDAYQLSIKTYLLPYYDIQRFMVILQRK